MYIIYAVSMIAMFLCTILSIRNCLELRSIYKDLKDLEVNQNNYRRALRKTLRENAEEYIGIYNNALNDLLDVLENYNLYLTDTENYKKPDLDAAFKKFKEKANIAIALLENCI